MARWCETVEMPGGGHAIFCHSGPRQKPAPCFVCGKTSIALCDYPVTPGAPGQSSTCDRPMCVDHNHKQFGKPNVDYCLEHWKIIQEGGTHDGESK